MKLKQNCCIKPYFLPLEISVLNIWSWRKRGSASNPKMEYQVLSCIFDWGLAMATLGLKEMGKFLWEGREKGGKSRKKGRARIKK